MVECQLPKLKVAGSSPVARSKFAREFLISILDSTERLELSSQASLRIFGRECQPRELNTSRFSNSLFEQFGIEAFANTGLLPTDFEPKSTEFQVVA
jgi:hypothetical protein